MQFSLLVTAAPCNSAAPATALRFAKAALHNGHSIYRIFFFRDGVHNASTYGTSPQDETHIPSAWQQFCSEQKLDAVICISAATKRGISHGSNTSPHTQIGGLGLLTEAIIHSDRLMTFG